MMKQIGIWLDRREAKIISRSNGQEKISTVVSNIEDFHPLGGSGTKLKGGPQDVVQDSKFLEREKHQYSEYFKEIAGEVQSADSLVIFGPAQSGKKLHKELQEKYPQLFTKVLEVKKADHLTDNQLKAWVRDYYQSA